MSVCKRGGVWWYRFNRDGRIIRGSTKQSNKRVAEQIEAARKVALAKRAAGIKEHAPALTVRESRFHAVYQSEIREQAKTLEYYEGGIKAVLLYPQLANCQLDEIRPENTIWMPPSRLAMQSRMTTNVLSKVFEQHSGVNSRSHPTIRSFSGTSQPC